MVYQTKQRMVEAEPVGSLLCLVETDFKSLPVWVKKAYQDQKLFFGFGSIQVQCINFIEVANSGDVLISHADGKLEILSDIKFSETYEALP
ncbi:hypothetical protein [Acinetobacter baumannii]|uniref:hypothetical protein n=1 Tax=Acinetobacter baumannii TaxID=470 RepID=UPI000BF5F723|nr:hypothetical protein [Acinetobacter baumannii]MDV7628897.1 hypothetical protein [Acinetobacter baumannii]